MVRVEILSENNDEHFHQITALYYWNNKLHGDMDFSTKVYYKNPKTFENRTFGLEGIEVDRLFDFIDREVNSV